MGKLTDSAVATASRTAAHSSAPKVPTSEQIRMAQLLVDPKSEDHSSLKDKVQKVMELTRCDENSAFVALHDCDNDVEQAVVNLLEGDQLQDEWIVQEGKKAKKPQHQPNSEDAVENDSFDSHGSKISNRRQRGTGNRGGGPVGGPDGPPRLRGRVSGAGRGMVNKESDSRGEFGSGERSGFSRGRGRGARDVNDRGGRGRGFGGRGGRRGGGGFNQSDSGGGFAQIDSWNSATHENNTWDNSMANTLNTPAGEWGKRRNNANNTWDNSMAHNDYDWGGEEDWSKLRDGIVIEPSSTNKSLDKTLAPSAGLAQAVSPAPAPSQADASRVRGESIDVNSLFGSNQQLAQQCTSSSTAWTASKQATADLKNELGIGKIASPVLGESTSHAHNRDSVPPKMSAAKVELPSVRATASIGPIDVQFGDMTLGADTSHGLFDFTAPTGYQHQNHPASTQAKEQVLRQAPQPRPQPSGYQRSAGGDHINGPDVLSSTRPADMLPKVDANPASYSGVGSFATQPSEQQPVPHSVQAQKPLQQQQPSSQLQQQQQFASNRVSHANINQVASTLPQRTANSGVSGMTAEHQRSQLLSSTNTNTGSVSVQHSAASDAVGGQQFSRDENLRQMNVGAFGAASAVSAASKNQASAGSTFTQPMAPYQQALASVFPYVIDQASLNYLQQTQNLLYNSGAYDMRAVSSIGGANMAMGRDTSGDMKAHMMRQENGSVMPTANAPNATVGNLSMPPPGLPGPTVSNAEAAAAIAQMALYPGFPLNVNYPPSGSPYLPPQFYVPNVSSTSAPTSGNQYQRSGGYQQTQALFGSAGYEELQQMSSQPDYGKMNYGVLPPPTQGKPVSSGGGSGMALGGSDVGNKYGAGMKGPYDSKQFVPATATPPPSLGNMNYTPAGTAPAHYNYAAYMQPVLNMNMMPAPAMPSNSQMSNDLLNQRAVNQNGKPPGGAGKGMGQQYQYGTPWGN